MRTQSTRELEPTVQDSRWRRELTRLPGGGTAAGIDLDGKTQTQASPVVVMATDHFDPVGPSVEPGTTVRFQIATGSHSGTAYENRSSDEASSFDSTTTSDGTDGDSLQ